MKRDIRIEFHVTEAERAAYDRARTTPEGEIPLAAWIRFVLNLTAAELKKQERTPRRARKGHRKEK